MWLLLTGCQERRAGAQRQLPHADGDSCEGLDRLPGHAIVAEQFGGSYSTRTAPEVGDGLCGGRSAGAWHLVREERYRSVAHQFLCQVQESGAVRGVVHV
jgi:hypothetical protein